MKTLRSHKNESNVKMNIILITGEYLSSKLKLKLELLKYAAQS